MPDQLSSSTRRHRIYNVISRPAVATAVVLIAAVILVFAKSMAKEMNSDEHPFVAAAALWSRYGLLPYRDFHYNHLPTLLMAYGLLFKGTDHLLLAARGFNCFCAAGVVATLFFIAYQTFSSLPRRRRWLLSSAIALIVLTNPLFTLATGIAWNHDFPTLMTLWAFCATGRGLRASGGRPLRGSLWCGLAGLSIALAFTSRLTFGPAAAVLAVWIAFGTALPKTRRSGLLAAFLIGALVASLPTLWMIARAPYNALWGNLLFPKLNTQYHTDDGAGRITLLGKVWFLLLDLVQRPGNGLLTIVAVSLSVQIIRRSSQQGADVAPTHSPTLRLSPRPPEAIALLFLTGALWLGCVFPTPIFRQYMYAPMPLFVLILIVAWKSISNRRRIEKWTLVVAVLSICAGCYHYRSVYRLALPSTWSAIKAHQEGVLVRQAVGPGRVLTFGPAIALEGGLEIYPELATGPYAYRVNPYLTDTDRAQLKLVDHDDLVAGFAARPPVAILTGFSRTLEVDLIKLAEVHGFAPNRLASGHQLFKPPGGVAINGVQQNRSVVDADRASDD